MKPLQAAALAALLILPGIAAPAAPAAKLRIFFIDVEGGQSTLFITPAGESLLIDTGWADHNGRDADRIDKVARQAGLNHLDYVLITHYHDDHVGGVPQLVARIPVTTFIDHGPNRETTNKGTEAGFQTYLQQIEQTKAKRVTVHPGEILPLKGMRALVVSADGNLLDHPLPAGGQPNAAACQASETRPIDPSENGRSLGLAITFGKLRILDLGDLTWDRERQLMCPVNKLGHFGLLIVSHHGWYQSSSPALIHGIQPRVAIMDNGETKGGSTPTFVTFASSPGLAALYQLHYSKEAGAEHNRDAAYIANLPGPDAGYAIDVTAARDGSFSVTNERTGATQPYPAP